MTLRANLPTSLRDGSYVTRSSHLWLIIDLLLKGEFPQIHRPTFESREVLRLGFAHLFRADT